MNKIALLIKDRQTVVFSVIAFIASFVAYVITLAPSIVMEDSAELITAAATLGIAHPSGYPLFIILGKLFSLLPFGIIPWRINLMSAVFGGLTASLLYLVLQMLVRRPVISVSLSLMYAFSPIIWSQSVIAEVYTLNSFFVTLLVLLALRWNESRRAALLYWFSFVFGLALTNHTMLVLLAPAFMLFFFLSDPTLMRQWRLAVRLLGLFCVGLSVYLFIPFRAFQEPLFNWGPIRTWHDVLIHITRSQYSDVAPFENQFSKAGIVLEFFIELYQQFYLPTIILAFGGLVYWWRTKRTVAILTLLIFLGNSIGIIYLRKFGWGRGIEYTYRVYYLPAFMMMLLWVGAICDYLINFLSRLWKQSRPPLWKISIVALHIIIVSLPVSFLVSGYRNQNMSDFWLNYDYSKNLLLSLPENSYYVFAYDGSIHGDTEIFSLVYLQMIEHVRPDVLIVSDLNFFYKRFQLNLPENYFLLDFNKRRQAIIELIRNNTDKPLYTNFAITEKNSDKKLWSLSNGYAYRIISASTTPIVAEQYSGGIIRGLEVVDVDSNYPVAGLAAHHYYNLAAHYLTAGHSNLSQQYLIQAFNLDNAPFNHEYRRFLDYRLDWQKRTQPGS